MEIRRTILNRRQTKSSEGEFIYELENCRRLYNHYKRFILYYQFFLFYTNMIYNTSFIYFNN